MEENTVNAALGGDSPVLDIDEFLGMPPLEENTVNVAQRGDGALQLQQGIPATGETGNDNLLLYISLCRNGGSNPSVSVAPAAATSTLFQASGSVSTVSLTQNQSLQPVSQGYPNQPQQLSNPTVHQLSQQPQQQIPQNQIPYQYRTPNWSPYQPHFASNPIRYQSLQLQQPQRSPQLVFYQYPTTHQSQQLHQRPVSQEPVPILNPRYLNPTQHQYPQ